MHPGSRLSFGRYYGSSSCSNLCSGTVYSVHRSELCGIQLDTGYPGETFKKKLSFETQTKIGQYVSLVVGIFSIIVAMVLANGGVKSAYEWFNGFMGLVLGILIGTFILGAFTKVANTFGATVAEIFGNIKGFCSYFGKRES